MGRKLKTLYFVTIQGTITLCTSVETHSLALLSTQVTEYADIKHTKEINIYFSKHENNVNALNNPIILR